MARVRSVAERLALARELARLLRLVRGDSWVEVYDDLVANHLPELPGSEHVAFAEDFERCRFDEWDAEQDYGRPFPEEDQ